MHRRTPHSAHHTARCTLCDLANLRGGYMVMRAMVMRASERARPASCLPPYNKCGSVRLECRERRSMTRTRTESDADRVRRGHRVIRGRGVHWSEKRGRTLDSGLWSTPTHNMKHPRHHAYELTTSRSRRSHVRIGTTCAKAEPNTLSPFSRLGPLRESQPLPI